MIEQPEDLVVPIAQWAGARPLIGLAVALVLSVCAAAPDCDRIPRVRAGVCPLAVAERQPAPDVTLPVL